MQNKIKKNNHSFFMNEAIKEAYNGFKINDGGPFGAVIVKNNKIIYKSHNKVIKQLDPTCHAEILAIKGACKKLKTFNLKGCVLYTTGFPCPMCMGACKWAHIKRIYYGCNEHDTTKIGFDDHKFYVTKIKATCLDRNKCLKLYSDYHKMPNRSHY